MLGVPSSLLNIVMKIGWCVIDMLTNPVLLYRGESILNEVIDCYDATLTACHLTHIAEKLSGIVYKYHITLVLQTQE